MCALPCLSSSLPALRLAASDRGAVSHARPDGPAVKAFEGPLGLARRTAASSIEGELETKEGEKGEQGEGEILPRLKHRWVIHTVAGNRVFNWTEYSKVEKDIGAQLAKHGKWAGGVQIQLRKVCDACVTLASESRMRPPGVTLCASFSLSPGSGDKEQASVLVTGTSPSRPTDAGGEELVQT